MTNKKSISLDDAYAVKTIADNVRLYRNWADTYEETFVDQNGYVAHLRVAELLARYQSQLTGPVADVGCGTGIGGAALRYLGISPVDGIDLSPEMLDQAASKKTLDGDPVYRSLIEADLTARVDGDSHSYGGLVSAGTFTHGHLGPEALGELWRLAAPGAVCVIGINASHFVSKGFEQELAAEVERQSIAVLELVDVDMYTTPDAQIESSNLQATVVVCKVT